MEDFDLKGAIINWVVFLLLIAIIFLISRSFNQLATRFGKTKWLYSIIGISTFFIGVSLGTTLEALLQQNNINIISGALRLPIGLLLPWAVYQALKKQWMKKN